MLGQEEPVSSNSLVSASRHYVEVSLWHRISVKLVLTAILCHLLSACSAEPIGIVGVMRDGSGFAAVVMTCEYSITSVVIAPAKPQNAPEVITWQVAPGYSSPLILGFSHGDPSFEVKKMGVLQAATLYTIDGFTDDASYMAPGGWFKTPELAVLEPGTALITGENEVNEVIPIDDLNEFVCGDWQAA